MSPLKSDDDVGFHADRPELWDGRAHGMKGSMKRFMTICRCCVRDGVPRRSLAVALVVGTVLNLINQGDALFGAHPLNPTKLLLTYLVPYCVATYGAVSYQLVRRRPAGLTLLRSDRDRTAIADPHRPI
jgi:hypothetical protein